MEESEVEQLVKILLQHTRLAKEALDDKDPKRRERIMARIEELRKERFEIIGR